MQIFRQKELLQNHLNQTSEKGKSIGFVPTMGALHEGHFSLVRKSLSENDLTVVSIFVNPTQFDNPQDLEKYPNTLAQDLASLADLGCDVVFTPTSEDIYGNQAVAESFDFGGIEKQMEGAFRPGHFDGVGTIVKYLFAIVQPTKAYFGEKDFQQLQIVKKLVAIENLDIQVVGCPILREENGLAMSSRNQRLTAVERQAAGIIYQTLTRAKEKYKALSILQLQTWVQAEFEQHGLLALEYFTIAEEESLQKVTSKDQAQAPRAFIAAYFGDVRLIDNMALYN